MAENADVSPVGAPGKGGRGPEIGAQPPEGSAPGPAPDKDAPTPEIEQAARLSETAKHKGPEQALEELAGQGASTPAEGGGAAGAGGQPTPEVGGPVLGAEQTPVPEDGRAQQDQSDLLQMRQELAQFSSERLQNRLDFAEQRIGNLTERLDIAQSPKDKAFIQDTLDALIAERDITASILEGRGVVRREAGGAGGGEGLPPTAEAATPGPENEDGSQRAPQPGEDAPRPQGEPEATEEERLIAAFERMTPEQLQRRIDGLDRTLSTIDRQLERVTSLDDMERLQDRRDAIQVQHDLFDEILESKGGAPTSTSGRGGRVTSEERTEAQREAKERVEYATKLTKMTPEERGSERLATVSTKEAVEEMLSGDLTAAQREAYNKQLQDADAKLKSIDKVASEKAPEEQKKVEEEAEENKRVEERKAEEDMVKSRAETATVEDLGFFRSALSKLKAENAADESRILELDNKITGTTDEAELKELRGERSEVRKRLTERRGMQKIYKDGFETASKNARTESGVEDAMSRENIREMPVAEYLTLNEDDRAKYLEEVAEVTKYSQPDYEAIKTKIEKGDPVSIKERAIFAKEVANRLIDKERGGYNMAELRKIAVQYPEVTRVVFDRVAASDAIQARIRERFPSNWENILDFAKKHPGWMMLILAILVGTTAAATMGVGALAGVGAGMAGSAGAGAGAFGVSRKRWA